MVSYARYASRTHQKSAVAPACVQLSPPTLEGRRATATSRALTSASRATHHAPPITRHPSRATHHAPPTTRRLGLLGPNLLLCTQQLPLDRPPCAAFVQRHLVVVEPEAV